MGEKTAVEDEHFVTRTLFRTQGPPHGLVASLLRPAVDDETLKVVPSDALFTVAGRLDLAKTYDQIKASSIAIAGEDGRQAFGQIEDAAAGVGLPIHAILDPLGEQWVLYEAPSTGGFLFTGVTLVVDVKDPDKLVRTLSILKKLLAAQFAPDERPVSGAYEADGVTIQYIDASRGFNLFSPAWAVADHKLFVALYPQVVEDAVRQFKAGGKSILDDAAFADTRRRTGGGGPLIYLSGPQFVSTVYPLAMPFFSAMRESFFEEAGAPQGSAPTPELIPSLQRLLHYVGSDAASFTVTPSGVLRTKSVANPLLSPFTLTDSIPLWVAAALPSMATSKSDADRTRSASHLRQIGQAILLYCNEHQGKMPPDLQEVAKTEDLTPDVLHSPFGDAKAAGDYTYFALDVLNKDVPPDVVIAYDAAELRSGEGANVLYADGHVEWLDRDGVNKALEKAAQWRANKQPPKK
jgi:prepilin-type processing-associated H-X9-DG protein